MAKVKKLVITCDRHGGPIAEDAEFLHLDVTAGKKTRGRTSHQRLDLCQDCTKDFLKFLEGKALKSLPTANQRVADGDI